MANMQDHDRARKLAKELVDNIIRSNERELEVHNQVGDTAYVFKELFDNVRRMYVSHVGANSGVARHYFDDELNARILSRMNRPSYK
jgi:hypothetical protein